MGVEREQHDHPFAVGSCTVPRVMRGENGQWSVEFELNFRVKLPDGREVRVTDRHVLVRANEQIGRKPHPGAQKEFFDKPMEPPVWPGGLTSRR